VVSIVNLGDQVGHRQLQLMHPESARLVARRQPQSCSKEEKNVGRLADQLPSGLQKGRHERRPRDIGVYEKSFQRRNSSATLGGQQSIVDVIGIGFLERKPDEFSASLNARPVVQAIQHE
jgi:hypothetical protein